MKLKNKNIIEIQIALSSILDCPLNVPTSLAIIKNLQILQVEFDSLQNAIKELSQNSMVDGKISNTDTFLQDSNNLLDNEIEIELAKINIKDIKNAIISPNYLNALLPILIIER